MSAQWMRFMLNRIKLENFGPLSRLDWPTLGRINRWGVTVMVAARPFY